MTRTRIRTMTRTMASTTASTLSLPQPYPEPQPAALPWHRRRRTHCHAYMFYAMYYTHIWECDHVLYPYMVMRQVCTSASCTALARASSNPLPCICIKIVGPGLRSPPLLFLHILILSRKRERESRIPSPPPVSPPLSYTESPPDCRHDRSVDVSMVHGNGARRRRCSARVGVSSWSQGWG